ncbi:MAG: hypothetical protein KOO62_10960 [candidate division Zixibacteria bacterium]|nr:hypothetical protein [candidate division Zixibacteria bacterium]
MIFGNSFSEIIDSRATIEYNNPKGWPEEVMRTLIVTDRPAMLRWLRSRHNRGLIDGRSGIALLELW